MYICINYAITINFNFFYQKNDLLIKYVNLKNQGNTFRLVLKNNDSFTFATFR